MPCSSLFSDVINCMQTDNLELKKLVYLYLMNYAKTQPDLAIMAVNTFVKDCVDPNPLIRALAVRTMGCIRVDKITEVRACTLDGWRECCRVIQWGAVAALQLLRLVHAPLPCSTCANPCASASRMRTLTSARRLPSAWPSSTTLTLSWCTTRYERQGDILLGCCP